MVQQTKEQRRQAEAVAARGRRCERHGPTRWCTASPASCSHQHYSVPRRRPRCCAMRMRALTTRAVHHMYAVLTLCVCESVRFVHR